MPANTKLSGALFSFLLPISVAQADLNPCVMGSKEIIANTRHRIITVCDENRAQVLRIRFAFGKGGLGKTREGDKKTPLGVYELAPLRPSHSFGFFIPVGYPTQDQIDQGYTGSAIGIHGPPRKYRRFGIFTILKNWTAGCIALSSDRNVDRLYYWMEQLDIYKIRIE